EPITFAGRAAFRLSVRGGFAQLELLWPGFPAQAVVDAQTGRLIRLTCYGGGEPARRHELPYRTPASKGGSGGIVYAVPPGVRAAARRPPTPGTRGGRRPGLREPRRRSGAAGKGKNGPPRKPS